MRTYWIVSLAALLLAACGGEETSASKGLELKSQKDRLSYAIGADHAQQLVKDPGFGEYDKEQIIKGFNLGLENPESFDMACQQTLQAMMAGGMQGGKINPQYKTEGSLCIGKLLGMTFIEGWSQENFIRRFDLNFVKEGFRSALDMGDTLLPTAERAKMIDGLISELNEKIKISADKNEKAFFDKVRSIPGVRELDQTGIFVETIEAGKGGSPGLADDVRAHYILISADGDTLQSSYDMGQPLSFNLSGGMIQAWSMAFPKLKKGGKYKLYVPNGLAYAGRPPQGSGIKPYAPLVFFVEVLDYGKPGSLTGGGMPGM